MRIFFLTILFLLVSSNLFAQNANIINVDNSQFPIIKVDIKSDVLQEDKLENILVFDGKEQTEYEIVKVSNYQPNERIFIFLVENSFGIYHNNFFDEYQKYLSLSLNLTKDNKVNYLFFGLNNKSNNLLRYLSTTPSKDKKLIRNMIIDNVGPNKDSSYLECKLYRSIEECFAYSKQFVGLDKENVVCITLISRGINLSPVDKLGEDFFAFAKQSGIFFNAIFPESQSINSIKNIEELCLQTSGNLYIYPKGEGEKMLTQIIERSLKSNPRILNNVYRISFRARGSDSQNVFSIKIDDNQFNSLYLKPYKNNFYRYRPWIISLIIMLLGAILIFCFRKKILSQYQKTEFKTIQRLINRNKKLSKELDNFRKHPFSKVADFSEFNASETLLGAGKVVPKMLIDNQGEKSQVELTKLIMTIGRFEDNDIVIDNRTVSAHHASLSFEGGNFFISDFNSTNGIFINDIRINKSQIKIDDVVRMGNVFFTIVY